MTDAVLLNISDMIDLAIGTPEVGVVDFNMLQTVLHCLAQQLRVLSKNVELRGSAANLPVNRDVGQTIAISEYAVETDDKTVTSAKSTTGPETILVVERVKKSDFPIAAESSESHTPAPPSSALLAKAQASRPSKPPIPLPNKSQITTTISKVGTKSVSQAVVPQSVTSTERLSLVTLSKFNFLESVVEDLKNRVYGSIPKNEDILQEVRSQSNLKAITDMWTSLNVSSRLEAAEEGIGKLSSIVQDLVSESSGVQDMMKKLPTTLPAITAPPEASEDAPTADPASPPSAAPPSTPAAKPTPAALSPANLEGLPDAAKEELMSIQNHLDILRADLDDLANNFYKMVEELQGPFDAQAEDIAPTDATAANEADSIAVTAPDTAPSIAATAKPTTPTKASIAKTRTPERQSPGSRRSITMMTADMMNRLNELEKKLNICCESIGKGDGVISDQIQSFQDQLEYLMKQVAELTQNLGTGKLSPDLVKDLQGLMQLFQTVQDMQEQLKQVNETALQLAAEKENRQHNLNALLEQIEFLKTVKLDREDMEEAMAEKADLRMLARKVSHDQFEMACDDLSKGLEHALGKLTLQEALWQQALDDIQREIEMKLDKMELSPVKDFFNSKLKQLQENLKQMVSLRREAEAAGTKRKLLRDVNCISCDAKAVMPMETETMPVLRPMPANFSMKPYLSYELDAIRKSQQTNLHQRNMHDWEHIDKQMGQHKPAMIQKAKSNTDKHLCNRYCGGSHTVTTPAQRVARLGHFIKQWGPDVLPLSSGFAAGDDGRLYKVSTKEGANVGPGGSVDIPCTPKPAPSKHEKQAKPPSKPLIIESECRCLEKDSDLKKP